jgi:signal transduction histidine kinase
VLADYAEFTPLWIVVDLAYLAVLVAAIGGLLVRYRRGDEHRRRHLLWLVLALVVMTVVIVPWSLFTAGPILELLSIALVPIAANPARVLSRMGERLRDRPEPHEVLAVVADALRLPYLALRGPGIAVTECGTAPSRTEAIALRYRGEDVGELLVGARTGEAALDRADRAALELLAVSLAAVVHATALADAVQRSWEQIVGAREEERRRLRRDLHDGLGPVLTGIAFRADAAGNLLSTDPARAAAQLRELRISAAGAIDDVRRLVYALRPPALDELGLVGALRRHVDQFDSERPVVAVHAPEALPPLPAAVEVAALSATGCPRCWPRCPGSRSSPRPRPAGRRCAPRSPRRRTCSCSTSRCPTLTGSRRPRRSCVRHPRWWC